MLFRQLFDKTSSTYTYLLADNDGQALLIDPVYEQAQRDLALLRELGLTLVASVETHVHADHVTSAWLLRQATGCKLLGSKAGKAEGLDRHLEHGDVVRFGGEALQARATPGHTDGCMTFVSDKGLAFTGDALLIRGAGRTDFQQGSAATLYHSIREQILSLPSRTMLYPAHDYAGRTVSTVAEELAHNPRIGGDASQRDFVVFMDNLGLAHPKKLDVAVPANLRSGKPEQAPPPPASWGPVRRTYAGLPVVDCTWVAENLGALHVLDVREADELTWELGAIEGAQHIPLGELRKRVAEVPKDKPVVTVCRSGARSGQAAKILEGAGYDVANMAGGMLVWRLGCD